MESKENDPRLTLEVEEKPTTETLSYREKEILLDVPTGSDTSKPKRYAYMRCLLRLGSDPHLRHVPLEVGKEYWVGRLGSNDMHIDDGMLSRKHAAIKVAETGESSLMDNKSANGTFVIPRCKEEEKLAPMAPRALRDLDVIKFGVTRPGTKEAPFRWRFHKALKFAENNTLPKMALVNAEGVSLESVVASGLKRGPDEDDGEAIPAPKKSRLSAASDLDEQLRKSRQQLEDMRRELERKEEEKENLRREVEKEAQSKVEEAQMTMALRLEEEKKRIDLELRQRLAEEIRAKESENKVHMETVMKKLEEEKSNLTKELEEAFSHESASAKTLERSLKDKEEAVASELRLAEERMAEERAALEARVQEEVEKKVVELKSAAERQREAMEAERRRAEEIVERDLREKEEKMKEELQKKVTEMEDEKKRLEAEYQEALRCEVQSTESALKEQLHTEKLKLEAERDAIANSLQEQMTLKMEEKDKALADELIRQKAKLDQELATRNAKEKLLAEELEKTKSAHAEAQLRSAQSVLADLEETMEMELQCAICSELFIDATTLNCCHSFCQFCIDEWKRRKAECPNCRKPIVSMNKSIVLDSYIDKMTQHLSQEMKDRRKILIDERNAAKAEADRSRNQGAGARGGANTRRNNTGNNRNRGSNRGSNRGNRGNRGSGTRGRGSRSAPTSNAEGTNSANSAPGVASATGGNNIPGTSSATNAQPLNGAHIPGPASRPIMQQPQPRPSQRHVYIDLTRPRHTHPPPRFISIVVPPGGAIPPGTVLPPWWSPGQPCPINVQLTPEGLLPPAWRQLASQFAGARNHF